MIIPIRNETDVKKLPYFTIGLIALNFFIWIFTNNVVNSQMLAIQEVRMEMDKIVERYASSIVMDIESIEEFEALSINDYKKWLNEEDFAILLALNDQFNAMLKDTFFYHWGFIPNHFSLLKLLTAMFIHANLFHVLGNMLFLWIVGCNIEEAWGWKVFLGFYLFSGLASAVMHMAMNLASTIPCIGASGAVSGVMGAFMIRHYKIKIRFAYFFLPWKPFMGTFSAIAGIWLPIWLLEQFVGAKWSSLSGTAYWAHIGGFAFGAVIGLSSKVFDAVQIPNISVLNRPKLTPEKMMDLHKRMLDGQSSAVLEFLPQIRQALAEDRENVTAMLILAELYFEKGRVRDSAGIYNAALHALFKKNALEGIQPLHQEVREKDLIRQLSESTILRLALFYENKFDFREAVKLYNLFINTFPESMNRPKVLQHAALILRTHLGNETAAEKALSYLKNASPASTQVLRPVSG